MMFFYDYLILLLSFLLVLSFFVMIGLNATHTCVLGAISIRSSPIAICPKCDHRKPKQNTHSLFAMIHLMYLRVC